MIGYLVLLSTIVIIALLLNGGLNQTVSRRIEYPQLLEKIKNDEVGRIAVRNNSLVQMPVQPVACDNENNGRRQPCESHRLAD